MPFETKESVVLLVGGGLGLLFLALDTVRNWLNPKCPSCRRRSSKPYEFRKMEWGSNVGGMLFMDPFDKVTRGRECDHCHTVFASRETAERFDEEWHNRQELFSREKDANS